MLSSDVAFTNASQLDYVGGRFLSSGCVQAGQDGRVYVAVKYPSISELWPEIYNNRSIRVVQVWHDFGISSISVTG